jgi:hypothetical protein
MPDGRDVMTVGQSLSAHLTPVGPLAPKTTIFIRQPSTDGKTIIPHFVPGYFEGEASALDSSRLPSSQLQGRR